MTATTALRSEHETILAVIACLRAACGAADHSKGFDAETFRLGIDFIRGYADGWHHAKEEVHLFPALTAAGMPSDGGPVGVMLHEHEIGRSYVHAMSASLEPATAGDDDARKALVRAALAYADLLEAHIAKEDGILFEMADRILPENEQLRIQRAYQTAIPDGATTETGIEFERLAHTLCERWNLDPNAVRSRPIHGGCDVGHHG